MSMSQPRGIKPLPLISSKASLTLAILSGVLAPPTRIVLSGYGLLSKIGAANMTRV